MKKKDKFLLGLIILATIALKIPSLFEPHWYFDEAIYSLGGKLIAQGFKLYTQFWDHKPPLLFSIYYLSYLLSAKTGTDILFWAKTFSILAVITTQISLSVIALSNKKNALLPPLIYGILVSTPLWEGNQANGEIFLASLTTTAIALIIKSRVRPLTAGILTGLSLLIKPVAIAEAIFLSTYTFFKKKKAFPKYLMGVILIGISCLIFFVLNGNFNELILANLRYNLKYTSGNNLDKITESIFSLLRITLILFSIMKIKREKDYITPWIYLTINTITLSFRPYLHYLIQLFPPLSLSLDYSKKSPEKKRGKVLGLALAIFILIIAINQKAKFSQTIPYQFDTFDYYKNFWEWRFKEKDEQEYIDFFRSQINLNLKIVQEIETDLDLKETLTQEQEKILIWGGEEAPWLYYELTELNLYPYLKYCNYFHVESNLENYSEHIREKIQQSPPLYIIIFPNTPDMEINDLIKDKYQLLKEIQEIKIYKKTERN